MQNIVRQFKKRNKHFFVKKKLSWMIYNTWKYHFSGSVAGEMSGQISSAWKWYQWIVLGGEEILRYLKLKFLRDFEILCRLILKSTQYSYRRFRRTTGMTFFSIHVQKTSKTAFLSFCVFNCVVVFFQGNSIVIKVSLVW